MNKEKKDRIIQFIEEEGKRIGYGKVHTEFTIKEGKVVNVRGYPERSQRLDMD